MRTLLRTLFFHGHAPHRHGKYGAFCGNVNDFFVIEPNSPMFWEHVVLGPIKRVRY